MKRIIPLIIPMILAATTIFGQRINPDKQIEKAPAPDYLLISGYSNKYDHVKAAEYFLDTLGIGVDSVYIITDSLCAGSGSRRRCVPTATIGIEGNILSRREFDQTIGDGFTLEVDHEVDFDHLQAALFRITNDQVETLNLTFVNPSDTGFAKYDLYFMDPGVTLEINFPSAARHIDGTTISPVEIVDATFFRFYYDWSAGLYYWISEDDIGTDDQVLSIDSTGRVFTISLEDGGSVTFQDQTGTSSTASEGLSVTADDIQIGSPAEGGAWLTADRYIASQENSLIFKDSTESSDVVFPIILRNSQGNNSSTFGFRVEHGGQSLTLGLRNGTMNVIGSGSLGLEGSTIWLNSTNDIRINTNEYTLPAVGPSGTASVLLFDGSNDGYFVDTSGLFGPGLWELDVNYIQPKNSAHRINVDYYRAYHYNEENALSFSIDGRSVLVGPYKNNYGDLLDNTHVGAWAGYNATGSLNTFVGYYAGYEGTATNQTAIGLKSGWTNSGDYTTAAGVEAVKDNSGDYVIGIGHQAGALNTFNYVGLIGKEAVADQANQLVFSDFYYQMKAKNYRWNIDQAIGAGSDGYVMTYDDGTGEIELKDPATVISVPEPDPAPVWITDTGDPAADSTGAIHRSGDLEIRNPADQNTIFKIDTSNFNYGRNQVFTATDTGLILIGHGIEVNTSEIQNLIVGGYNTIQDGHHGTIFGTGNQWTGTNTSHNTMIGVENSMTGANTGSKIAVGRANVITGNMGIGIGYSNDVGKNTVGMGYNTTATGQSSVVGGYAARGQGDNAVGLGPYAYATTEGMISIGAYSQGSSLYGILIGGTNKMSGTDYSGLFGYDNELTTTTADNSFAFGNWLQPIHKYSMIFGSGIDGTTRMNSVADTSITFGYFGNHILNLTLSDSSGGSSKVGINTFPEYVLDVEDRAGNDILKADRYLFRYGTGHVINNDTALTIMIGDSIENAFGGSTGGRNVYIGYNLRQSGEATHTYQRSQNILIGSDSYDSRYSDKNIGIGTGITLPYNKDFNIQMGFDPTCTGGISNVLLGLTPKTSSSYGVAIGYTAEAGYRANAIGDAKATGTESNCIGYTSNATGLETSVFGTQSGGTGIQNLGVGYEVDILGDMNHGFGRWISPSNSLRIHQFIFGSGVNNTNRLSGGSVDTSITFGLVSNQIVSISHTEAAGGSSKVGILTTTPATEFDLNGEGTIRKNLYIGGSLGSLDAKVTIGKERISDGNSYIDLVGEGTGGTYTNYGARLIRNSGAAGNTQLTHRGDGDLILNANESAADISLKQGGTVRLFVENGGEVGIGTTTPTASLDVNGSARIRTIARDTTATKILVADDDGNIGYKGDAFATMYVYQNSTSQTFTDDVFERITAFDSVKYAHDITFDADSATLSPAEAGLFLVIGSFGFSGTVSSDWEIMIFVDGVPQYQAATPRKIGTGGDRGSATLNGVIYVPAGGKVDARFMPTTGNDSATLQTGSVTIKKLN